MTTRGLIMRTPLRFAAALLALALPACTSLTGPKLTDDPNNPTQATAAGLFVSAQANLYVQFEGNLPRTVCVWMQQCSAQATYANYGTYQVIGDGNTWFGEWASTYGGGGLIDLRRIQKISLAAGDSTFAGIANVMEAMLVGLAADTWGDIPYSQAADTSIATPVLDSQDAVYAAVQAKLSTAITQLSATGPTNIGPGSTETSYGGDRTKWLALAHTLKARFYLHTAEKVGATAYASALAEAQQGIADGDDYRTAHGSAVTASNIWSQFTSTQAPDYIAAGKFLVDLLQSTSDPALGQYFARNANGLYVGADPGEQLNPSEVSTFSSARVNPTFAQPVVTAAENQLIIAEAQYQTAPATGLATLNAVRATRGLGPLSPAPTGTGILQAIITEKYIQGFQGTEVWSDYRRTCFPALVPYSGATNGIPARLPYPQSERNANPNITGPGPARNPNDVNGCP